MDTFQSYAIPDSIPEGLTITVYNAGEMVLASVYSNKSKSILQNPFLAGVNGNIKFYGDNGRYDIKFGGEPSNDIDCGWNSGSPFILTDVPLSDCKDIEFVITENSDVEGTITYNSEGKIEVDLTVKNNSHSHDTYIFDQLTPSNEWVINHNLNKYPSVAIVDNMGLRVFGGCEYNDLDTLTLTFSVPFYGKVYLN